MNFYVTDYIFWSKIFFKYISHEKFWRDKVSVKKFTETLFAEISERPKLCRAETFWKVNFLHFFLNLSYWQTNVYS